MNGDQCIYFDSGICMSLRLAHVKPCCPYWTQTRECACGGKLGMMGRREWHPQPSSFRVPGTPAPLALRG